MNGYDDTAVWFQAWILLGGVVVALATLIHQRRTAAERADRDRDVVSKRTTLQFISTYEIHTGTDWARTINTALAVLENRDRWHPLLSVPSIELSPRDRLTRHETLTFLNHQELVAIGIRTGALDRDLYLQWAGSSYLSFWKRSSNAIAFLQEKRPKAFREFQDLADSISA